MLDETDFETGLVDLAVGAGGVWAVFLTSDAITRVDPVSLAITDGFRVRSPDTIAAEGEAVWVTSERDGTLTRYDTVSADVRTIDVGGTPTGLAVGGDSVWVAVTV